MFPRAGFQIIIESGSPEDFHVMEVKNVSRDGLSVTDSGAGARANRFLGGWSEQEAIEGRSLGDGVTTVEGGMRGSTLELVSLIRICFLRARSY
jgi:hypothetical protein